MTPGVKLFALSCLLGGLLFAQAPAGPGPDGGGVPGVSSFGPYVGLGVIAGSVITAVGTSIVQPYLRQKGTEAKLADAESKLKDALGRIDTLETKVAAKEAAEGGLIQRLSLLTDKNTRLADMNLRLAHTQLVGEGHQRAGAPPTAAAFLVDDAGVPEGGPTVLVVDDSESARNAVARVLELRGCKIEEVGDLPEALAAVTRRPDFIVLDLMLPHGDGTEVLALARDLGIADHVIVTTGRDESTLGPVYALGPLAVFTKPFDLFGGLFPLILKPPVGAKGAAA
jgi:CheY-like chemotaxis protein